METDISFGTWIRRRRKALDLTKNALAQRVGCSLALIEKIESGARRPSRQIAEILADVLELPECERSIFMKVARGERSIDRLTAPPPLPDLNLLQSSQTLPSSIPTPLTLLIGRETELCALRQMLGDPQCRLITLVGPGGIGKTRLAIEAARAQEKAFAHGVCFVSLASLNSPSFIAPAISSDLGFKFSGSTDPVTQLLEYLRKKQLLLVLDNFEHLLDGVDLLVEIIRFAPHVKILCTSREQLNVQGEWVFEVRGLPVPEAEALFVSCARRIQTDLLADEANRQTITHICHLVEGIPLAIELAAAWTRILSLAEIEQEIQRNLDFLSTMMRDLPERHRSMRAVFEHSWRLLTQEEQQALSRLSVFRGGFTREAGEQVVGITLDVLCALVAKSLIQRNEEKRFSMHELVRQYAAKQLETADETEQVQQRHVTFFTDFAEDCREHFGGPLMATCLERMEQDNDNLRAALDYSITLQVSHMAWRLSAALWRFWQYRGRVDEGRRWLKAIVVLPDKSTEDHTLQRAKALNAAGALARIQGDFAQARPLYEQSLALRRKAGDERGISAALNSLGLLSMFEGKYAEAVTYFHESLQLFRKLGIKTEIVRPLNNLGIVAMYQGDYERSRLLHEETLGLYQELNDRHGVAGSLGNLGDVMRYQGEYDCAMQVLEESLALLHEIGDVHGLVVTLASIARVHLAKGNVNQALATFHASLMQNQQVGDKTEVVHSLEGIAEALGEHAKHSPETEDEIRLAVRLLAAAGQLRASVGAPRSAAERAEFDHIVAQLRGQLSKADFLLERKRGAEMTSEQAVEVALVHLSQISAVTDVD